MQIKVTVPSVLGDYSLKGTIGSGSFSIVKLAQHQKTKEYFACKIVPRNKMVDDGFEIRFEREIRINQQIHHQNVVQIIDLMKDEMNFYIFMEFCPNGELFNHIINMGKLEENEAADFTYQILNGIKHVHELGIAHRDLKPENILFDINGMLKISDFGLSKFVGKNGLVETPCGSPCYASPECLSGQPYDGRRSDLWSIGVILFAMVTGQLPWTKRNQLDLYQQIRAGDFTIPSTVSEKGADLIRRFMTVDINKRITVEQALNHPWIKENITSDVTQDNSVFKIVSLKKVDEFFHNDKSITNNSKINENRNNSFNFSTYKSIVKLLSDQSGFSKLLIPQRYNKVYKGRKPSSSSIKTLNLIKARTHNSKHRAHLIMPHISYMRNNVLI